MPKKSALQRRMDEEIKTLMEFRDRGVSVPSPDDIFMLPVTQTPTPMYEQYAKQQERVYVDEAERLAELKRIEEGMRRTGRAPVDLALRAKKERRLREDNE